MPGVDPLSATGAETGTVATVAIPDFQTLMRPLLLTVEDGEPRAIKDVRAQLASEFELDG